MNVTACLVTRGDVDLSQIVDSIASAGIPEIVVWDNSEREDLAVYGRYAAITEASHDLIYVQDDDLLHDPASIQKMVSTWVGTATLAGPAPADASDLSNVVTSDHIVCNMPANFRQPFYQEHSLVGFGAVFHRDLPEKTFNRFWDGLQIQRGATAREMAAGFGPTMQAAAVLAANPRYWPENFLRTCDIVFTALNPRSLVDVDYRDMDWASAPNRMWQQPTHREERGRMLDLVLKLRDAGV